MQYKIKHTIEKRQGNVTIAFLNEKYTILQTLNQHVT
jgi:hypothetical protein